MIIIILIILLIILIFVALYLGFLWGLKFLLYALTAGGIDEEQIEQAVEKAHTETKFWNAVRKVHRK